MKHLTLAAVLASTFGALSAGPTHAAAAADCVADLPAAVPARPASAQGSRAVVEDIASLSGPERDAVVTQQLLAGNFPDFLRELAPVTLNWTTPDGEPVDVTICVTPDYMAIGPDSDFVRVPVGLPAAVEIASGLGFLLPTPKMVDAIYMQAKVHLDPAPMPPTAQMSSTDYFFRHNATIEGQRDAVDAAPGVLTAGQKKDIVLTTRLASKSGRVAIYGWHQQNGQPIQPLSTVHGKNYADYSHGIRLVSATAFVNGEPRSLTDILQDPDLAGAVSSEGPIPQLDRLLTAIR